MSEKRLPPLAALRAFELSARLGSFTSAAARMSVSQSAITRHIAALEANVGAKLFTRKRHGVELTPDGKDYFAEISPTFELLASATARLRERGSEQTLRLRVYPIFAVKWLIPRLNHFRVWAPTVKVELDTTVAPADFERTSLDAAIQFGAGDRSDVQSEHLISDEIEPVCAPSLLSAMHVPLSLDDLMRLPLLHARYRRADWQDWAAANNRPDLGDLPGTEWPSSVLTYHAALEGLGVAMGQTRLLETDFERGVLVRLFRQSLCRPLAYYLHTPIDRPPPLRVRTFRNWLSHTLGTR